MLLLENPERLKKVEGNGETLASRLTCSSFSSSLATSLSPQASDSFPRKYFTEVKPCPAELVGSFSKDDGYSNENVSPKYNLAISQVFCD